MDLNSLSLEEPSQESPGMFDLKMKKQVTALELIDGPTEK